jgi:hypothetical protein
MSGLRSVLFLVALTLLVPHGVRAEEGPASDLTGEEAPPAQRPRFDAAANARQGLMAETLVAPGSRQAGRVTAVAFSGYDGARRGMIVRSFLDANIYGPLDLRAGVSYLPNGVENAAKPHAGLRVRALNQDKHHVDLAFGLFYRLERFTEDEGMVQALVALGTRIDKAGLFANLTYGQDPEGDDREGEVMFAFLYELLPALQLGFETRLRIDLASDDPRRAARKASDFDGTLTPTLSYSLGPIAPLAHVGASTMHTNSWHIGAVGTGGLAAVY